MAYFNTNNKDLAYGLYGLINRLLGYRGAKFFKRDEDVFIKKYGLYRVGLNNHQEEKINLSPKEGSMFNEEEVRDILRFN